MITTRCEWCGKEVKRGGSKPGRFCSLACKGEWQKTQKPVDKDWLYQKYVVEGLGTYQISKLVNRNPKQVYEWLLGYGIEIRKRDWSIEAGAQPFHDRDWLYDQYVNKELSAQDIASQFDVTEALIYFWLRKFDIERRNVSEARDIKHWGSPGEKNGMFGRRGEKHANWKGGCTPERQAVYSSIEWAKAVKVVRQRDKGTCQRCQVKASSGVLMHIHHIVSFSVRELRTEPTNLVLLCINCHHFVHSPANINREFMKD
jgi:hypothetical protein